MLASSIDCGETSTTYSSATWTSSIVTDISSRSSSGSTCTMSSSSTCLLAATLAIFLSRNEAPSISSETIICGISTESSDLDVVLTRTAALLRGFLTGCSLLGLSPR